MVFIAECRNKRIALKLQNFILRSFAYLCSFSWIPDPILSRRNKKDVGNPAFSQA